MEVRSEAGGLARTWPRASIPASSDQEPAWFRRNPLPRKMITNDNIERISPGRSSAPRGGGSLARGLLTFVDIEEFFKRISAPDGGAAPAAGLLKNVEMKKFFDAKLLPRKAGFGPLPVSFPIAPNAPARPPLSARRPPATAPPPPASSCPRPGPPSNSPAASARRGSLRSGGAAPPRARGPSLPWARAG